MRAAEKGQISYSEFLPGLLRAQWHERQESALAWRIRQAKLPERWSLETFPWPRQPSLNRKQIRAFAGLDFVAKHENLGAQDLFDEMYASLADRSTRQLLNRLARLDVLS